MPDFAGRASPVPGRAVEHHSAADTSAPEHPEQGPVGTAGAKLELGVGGHGHIVADRHGHAELLAQCRPEGKAPLPVGQVARARHRASGRIGHPWRADPDAGQLFGRELGPLAGLVNRGQDRCRHVLGAAAGGRGVPRVTEDLVVVVEDRHLDLGAAEVDSGHGCAHAQDSR